MDIRSLPIEEVAGHILIHNIADARGQKLLKKGTRLTPSHIETLRGLERQRVEVAILAPEDVHEDEAAATIAEALAAGSPLLRLTRAVGGRVNLHVEAPALLYLERARLVELNSLPGVTLATRPPYTPLAPLPESSQAATLKIIPYAISRETVEAATGLAGGTLRVAPLPASRVALLITAEEGSQARIREQFERPTRERLQRLGSDLATIESVPPEEEQIAEAAGRLLDSHPALIIGGQTSVMDSEDTTPRALTRIGARVALHGAPVEPGNLLALAYRGERWILCAPGCAKSPQPNVVDLILPRLLAGERLERREIAELGAGGLL